MDPGDVLEVGTTGFPDGLNVGRENLGGREEEGGAAEKGRDGVKKPQSWMRLPVWTESGLSHGHFGEQRLTGNVSGELKIRL